MVLLGRIGVEDARDFYERDLQCEHIVPESRGGRWTWMNLVTACGVCNDRTADRTPEEAGMPLVYLPYVPSRFEDCGTPWLWTTWGNANLSVATLR